VIVEFRQVRLIQRNVDPLALVGTQVFDRCLLLPGGDLFREVSQPDPSALFVEVPEHVPTALRLQKVINIVE